MPDDVDPSFWKSQLRGEPIKVQKTHIRPKNSNNDRLNTHGSYAYWVGDEGVKSKANLNKPEESLGSTELEQMDDVSVATYPNTYMQKISDFLSGGCGLDFVEDRIPVDAFDWLLHSDSWERILSHERDLCIRNQENLCANHSMEKYCPIFSNCEKHGLSLFLILQF